MHLLERRESICINRLACYPFMKVLIYFRNLRLLVLLLLLCYSENMCQFLIFYSFSCRMERFFLCHNWGDEVWTAKPSPNSWDAKMFCLALITEVYLSTIPDNFLLKNCDLWCRFFEAARRWLRMESSSYLFIEDSLWVAFFCSNSFWFMGQLQILFDSLMIKHYVQNLIILLHIKMEHL
jgi:hypothetical protein